MNISDMEMRIALSEIGKRQSKYIHELSMDTASARKQATVEYCGELGWTPEQFNHEWALWTGKFPRTKTENDKSETIIQDETTYTGLYANWCAAHDHVCGDDEAAYFTGCGGPAIGYARRKLITDKGYEFEKNGNGWNIKRPKEEKKYTEKEVRAMMEKLIKEFGQPA